MSLNKNLLWTAFFFLSALMSPNLFALLSIPKAQIPNLTAIAYIVGAIVISYIYLKTSKKNTLSKERIDFRKVVGVGLLGILLSWFLQTIIMLIETQLFNQPVVSQNTADVTDLIKKAPFFVVAVTIAGPIMEEYVFRFSLINFLNQKLPTVLSALISSSIFAVLHGDGHYLLYGGLGLFFYYLYQKTGSILTSIITHAGMNTLVVIVRLLFIK